MHHGVATTHHLLATGWSAWQIRRAVRSGALLRLRHGWYARPDADPRVMSAVRSGGFLSCISALDLHGVWVPHHHRPHVRPSRSRDLHTTAGLHSHAPLWAVTSAHHEAVDPLPLACAAAFRCLDHEDRVVIIDSILHQGLMTRATLEHIARRARAGAALRDAETFTPRLIQARVNYELAA